MSTTYHLKYCMEHDSLWETSDICQTVLLERTISNLHDHSPCRFVFLNGYRRR